MRHSALPPPLTRHSSLRFSYSVAFYREILRAEQVWEFTIGKHFGTSSGWMFDLASRLLVWLRNQSEPHRVVAFETTALPLGFMNKLDSQI